LVKKSGENELEIKSGATSALQFTGANVDVRGDLTVTGGNITNALQFDGDVSLNGGHLGLQFVDGSKNSIGFPDNMESGLIVNEGANAYMAFNSTDNEEEISLIQDTRIVDDKKIEFGTHSDASIEYDNDGTSQLRFAGAAAIFEQAVTFAGGIANPGTVTTTDIDGGTIDGTVIGASSQAAGDFTAIGAVAPGTIVGTTIDATTDFTIASLVVTDDQIQMTPSTNDVVTIAGATNGILNITTVDDAGTSGDVNLTADGQVEYRANDAAGHIFDIAGTDQLSITDGVIAPVTDNDIALGTTALSYSDLFLADGSVLNLDNGDITLTHSDGKLTLGGDGDVEVDFNDHEMTNVDINSGNIDGVRIGYNAGRGGKFSNLWTTGQIWLQNDANDAGVGLKSPDALGASYSLEFPADDGSNNEVLITNGSGVLSWGTVNTANITADAIDATKIADDVIDDEHIDPMFMSSIAGGAVVDGNDIVLLRDPGVGIKARSLTDIFGVMGRPEAPPTPNSSSDRRFKKNISTVSGALQKLSKLNPVNYDWRQDEFENKGFNDKKQWGFIAQEIKEIFPELVGKDDEDFLTLNYQGFVPLLTKAVQEQQEEIDSQQKEIDALKSQLQMIMDMLDNDMSDKTDSKKDNDNKKPVKLSMATPK
jgi:hypothetical protein